MLPPCGEVNALPAIHWCRSTGQGIASFLPITNNRKNFYSCVPAGNGQATSPIMPIKTYNYGIN